MKDKEEGMQKKIELGRCGSVTMLLSADEKRLLVAFDIEPEGFDKTGLNGFIDALKKVRGKMQR